MNIKIDENLCIGCGTCQALCPECFKVEALAQVISTDCDVNKIKSAVEACPVVAISIED